MAKRRSRNTGKLAVFILVIVVLVAMCVQIFRLKSKVNAQEEQLGNLQEQYEEESERAEELAEQEAYMQTMEYIEDLAKSKLGLAYENEIIFKESDD